MPDPKPERSLAFPVFAFVLAVLLGSIFSDPLFGRRSFAGRDFVRFFLPVEKVVHEEWSRARVPLWMPEVSFGRVLAANPNLGVFYPPRIAMALLPLGAGLKLFPVFHLWLAGLGAFALTRFLAASPAAAGMAGIVYAFSGPALSEIDFFDFIPGFALLPWVILAAGALARRPSFRAAALFGLVWGCDLLAGDVFTAGLAMIGAGLLTWQEGRAGARARGFPRLLAASVPGFLLAGTQIVPTLVYFPWSVRALTPVSLGAATEWSLSLWRLTELAVPFPFGRGAVVWGDRLWSGRTSGFFATLYPGAFGAAALFLARPVHARRPLLYGLLGTSLILSVAGFYLPEVLRTARSPIPLRYPEKLAVGIALAAALAAAVLLDALRSGGARRRAILPAAVGASLLIASAAASRSPESLASFVEARWTTVPPLASLAAQRLPSVLAGAAAPWFLLAGLLALWTPRRNAAMTALAGLLVVAELGSLARTAVATDRSDLVLSPPPVTRLVRRVDAERSYRFVPLADYIVPRHGEDPLNEPFTPGGDRARRELAGFAGAAFGISYAFNIDYDRSDFYRVELARRELLRDEARWEGATEYLQAFSGRTAAVPSGETFLGFTRALREIGGVSILEDPSALPAVRFAEEVREVPGLVDAFGQIRGGDADLGRVAVVESGRSHAGRLSPGTARVVLARRDRLELETSAAGPSRLLLLRAHSPFREVLVDGGAASADPTNLCLSSIALTPGRHRIAIRERLPGGPSGPLLSALGAAAIALLALRDQLSRRESSRRA